MYRTIYLSAATRLLTEPDIEALLAVSRRNNARDGITGLLMYHDGSFLQVLEGEKSKVEACFSRISADRSHRNVLRLFQGEVAERLFSEWSMGFSRPDDIQAATGALTELDQIIAELPRLRALDSRAAILIRSFFVVHRDFAGRVTG